MSAGSAPARNPHPDLLALYLVDHFTGATAGLELFERSAANRRGTPAGREIERVAREIAEDRETLHSIMEGLGVETPRYRLVLAWLGEKATRLKANGRVVRRSPLSDLVELDAMYLAVRGKQTGWDTLRTAAEHDDRLDPGLLDELLARAGRQLEALEALRREEARTLFGS